MPTNIHCLRGGLHVRCGASGARQAQARSAATTRYGISCSRVFHGLSGGGAFGLKRS
jgi:hypothetical protein